jgi:fatty-acyl-CoA synthase
MNTNLPLIEKQLLLTTRQFLLKQPNKRALHLVSLDASLERQLGIDSLGKVELFHQIEKTLALQFSDETMGEADTLKDIAKAALTAKPSKKYTAQTLTLTLETLEINLHNITSLPDALIQYAVTEPDRPHIYLPDEEGNETIITYGELLAAASGVAHNLVKRGIKPNDTVAIMLPTGAEFFQSFMGILLAGAVPVPIYPPLRADRIEAYAVREARILNNAQIRLLITFTRAETLSKILQTSVPSLKAVVNGADLISSDTSPPDITLSGDQPALIQYTSGSTGDPKGVLLTHNNILANIRSIEKPMQIQSSDAIVSWLPLYHDMGLMSWMGTIYYGIPFIALSPISFLNRPERWLWMLHYHRATISAAPNFAYELCVKRIEDADIEGLDLSAWRVALNGAEAVRPETLKRFYHKFKAYGLREEALTPVYGLAENTVALTFPDITQAPRIDTIDRNAFERHLKALPSTDKNAIAFACEGKAMPEHEIRIVNDQDELLPERHIGHLQFKGPSAMQGYYLNSEATKKAYRDGWWHTGDFAYMADEELFVTGREKDLIIKGGRNLYPETIEDVTGNITGVRRGCVVAFGVTDIEAGTEKIVVVAESKLPRDEHERLNNTILSEISNALGISPDDIIIAPPHTIPKTSSGKLQRSACKEAYIKNELVGQQTAPHIQMAKLYLRAVTKRVLHFTQRTFKFIYTCYALLCISIIVLPLWLTVLTIHQKHAAKIIKFAATGLSFLIFCPIKQINKFNIPQNKPVIFCANHASYTDAWILLATLPAGTRFAGKKELFRTPILASIMKKLQVIPINRAEFSQSVDDLNKMKIALASGHSLLIFPEATFTYASGIRSFKTGAFQLAVDTHTSICPIAIQGTRNILRDGARMLSPQKVTVIACEEIQPAAEGWDEVVRLQTLVRKTISKACKEPMIEGMSAGVEKSI